MVVPALEEISAAPEASTSMVAAPPAACMYAFGPEYTVPENLDRLRSRGLGVKRSLALREFLTLSPTPPGDHRTLTWVFFLILPAHFFFAWAPWYGMFLIWIPVYAFVFIPIRSAPYPPIEWPASPRLLRLASVR